jgi:hypothetical protein
MDQQRTRSIECDGPQMVRHRMLGRPDLEKEPVAAADVEWGEHTDNRLDHSPLEERERKYVGGWRWNGCTADAFKRADHSAIGVVQDCGELVAVALDIDGGDKLVVAPNLLSGAVRDWGGGGSPRSSPESDRPAPPRRRSGRLHCMDWYPCCDTRCGKLPPLRFHPLGDPALGQCPRATLPRGPSRSKSGDEAPNVEIADWQRTVGSVAEQVPLQ